MNDQAKFNYVTGLTSILAAVGAVNWGLVEGFNFNLVTTLLGDGSAKAAVYYLVALSGLYVLVANVALMFNSK